MLGSLDIPRRTRVGEVNGRYREWTEMALDSLSFRPLISAGPYCFAVLLCCSDFVLLSFSPPLRVAQLRGGTDRILRGLWRDSALCCRDLYNVTDYKPNQTKGYYDTRKVLCVGQTSFVPSIHFRLYSLHPLPPPSLLSIASCHHCNPASYSLHSPQFGFRNCGGPCSIRPSKLSSTFIPVGL